MFERTLGRALTLLFLDYLRRRFRGPWARLVARYPWVRWIPILVVCGWCLLMAYYSVAFFWPLGLAFGVAAILTIRDGALRRGVWAPRDAGQATTRSLHRAPAKTPGEVVLVYCSRCGKRNRVSHQPGADGVHYCGACHTPLVVPRVRVW
jgi:hypothetical protein